MRILVISNLFPPVVRGGFEVECSAVVERLRESHELLVLTSSMEAPPPQQGIRRELPFLTDDARGAARAPRAALAGVRSARRALEFDPQLVYCWNPSNLPQALLRVIADAGVPIAFRVCDHSLGDLFGSDQFMRELLPARRGPARALWSRGCRALNRHPELGLVPLRPFRAAICWNSQFIRSAVGVPPFIEPALERVVHSVPRHGAIYEAVRREPAEQPEIVFLGRVTPYKGLEIAIRAIAELASSHALTARLVVIGPEDADHAAQMRSLAARLAVAESVLWRGQQTPERAAEALSRAHAVIVPSLWEEPFPLVTIEAALAGIPVVAADVGGIAEGMHDEEHALLYPAEDVSAAAAALARVLGEHEQTAARVERARARAREFGLEAYLRAQERFVADAAAALGASAPRG